MWSVGGMILTGETEVLAEKPVTVSHCSPQTLQTDVGSIPGLRGDLDSV